MKIAVYSDLHLEFEQVRTKLRLMDDADVRVLAGDILAGKARRQWVLDLTQGVPTIMIAGNHEAYSTNYHIQMDELRDFFNGTNVHFCENQAVEIDGIRFLATTLWTDFELLGTPALSAAYAEHKLNDYRNVTYHPDGRTLMPEDTRQLCEHAKGWLSDRLGEGNRTRTVVVTHHAPSPKSIPKHFQGDVLSPAYASNLEPLIERFQPSLWVHGHIHDSCDYYIGDTRVICNPRGYAGYALNSGFRNPCVVEI